MIAFTALALLPDADVLLVALGATDHGPAGHRGASHSLTMAAFAGLLCGLAARWRRWPVLRTALIGAFAVASHALLDVLGEGDVGCPCSGRSPTCDSTRPGASSRTPPEA